MKGSTMLSRRPQSAKETVSKPGPGAYQESYLLTRPNTAKYGYVPKINLLESAQNLVSEPREKKK